MNKEVKKLIIDPKKIPLTRLAQLIEEVRNEEFHEKPSCYNRFHTRHNKSR